MPPGSSRPTPGEGLRALLDSARGQDAAAAEDALLERAVGALVPDEALLLEQLCLHARVPLVQIWARPLTGAPGEPVLENASLVGRLAGVALPALTPAYVGRLLWMGLVQSVPADDLEGTDAELADEFHALLGDPLVLRALARANVDGSTPRVVRQALSLSPLGSRLVREALSVRPGQVDSTTDEP